MHYVGFSSFAMPGLGVSKNIHSKNIYLYCVSVGLVFSFSETEPLSVKVYKERGGRTHIWILGLGPEGDLRQKNLL